VTDGSVDGIFSACALSIANFTTVIPDMSASNGMFLTTNGTSTSWANIGGGGGDMFKATYDTNTNNIIDIGAGGTGSTNGSITGTGVLSFTSANGSALNLDSGTIGDVNLGTGNNVKTISMGRGLPEIS